MILDLVIKLLLYFCAIASLIMFMPGKILLDIHPKAFKESLPKSLSKFKSIESVNVSHFEQIGPLHSPESIGLFKGRLVTGSSDGYLYEIASDDTFKPLLKIIDDSKCSAERKPCGQPLGLKFDSKGVLFVVEPSHGVYRVENVFSKTIKPTVTLVFDIKETAALGQASVFLDDVGIQEKSTGGHILYLSDVSTKFSMEESMLVLFGSDKGRIISYDTDSKKISVIASDVFFPNGVEVVQTGNNEAESVLFAEFATRSIWRYDLKGTKAGTLQKIISQLPGEPDNIRRSANGKTFWIGLLKPRTLLQPSDFDYYIKKPLLRKMIARISYLLGGAMEPVGRLLKNEFISELAYSMRTLEVVSSSMLPPDGGMMIEIDANGNVLDSVYSDNDSFGQISEVREVPSTQANQRVFYIGSYAMSHFRKLILTKN